MNVRTWNRRALLASLALAAVAGAGCKRTPMGKIEQLKGALVNGDAQELTKVYEGLPACPPPASGAGSTCLTPLAQAFGAQGFHTGAPDHASAAAAAVLVLRDKQAYVIPSPEPWLASVQGGNGTGGDVLRLAIARAMAAEMPKVAHAYESETEVAPLLAAVAATVPGACRTYALLGAGADDAKLPPEQQADHAPCVQRDLGRKGGPGGRYGYGPLRAAEGALALWKAEAAALKDGATMMEGGARTQMDAALAVIEPGVAAITLKKLEAKADLTPFLTDAHGDAGVALKGAAGAADAGVGAKGR